MNILLNQDNVALFIGKTFTVTDTCVLFSDGSVCNDLSASNTTVIDTNPPAPPVGNAWKWQDNAWVCIDQAAVDAHVLQQKASFNAEQRARRAAAYVAEADPLFFKAQRGDVALLDWQAKVDEIKARFAYQQ